MNGRTNSNSLLNTDVVELSLDPPTNVDAQPFSGHVDLSWTDAKDKYATPEGEVAASPQLMAAKWDHTTVIRKVGSDPMNTSDGTLVTKSSIRNQYQSTSYIDNTIINDTEYHYGLFSVTDSGIISSPYIIVATPKSGTRLSELADGTIITITEDGSPVEFLVAKHDYESALNGNGRVLLMRGDQLDDTINFNANGYDNAYRYETDTQSTYLNTTYKPKLSAYVRSLITSTKIYCTSWNNLDVPYAVEQDVFAIAAREINYVDPSSSNDFDKNLGHEGTYIPIAFEHFNNKPIGSIDFLSRTCIDRYRVAGNNMLRGGKGVYISNYMGELSVTYNSNPSIPQEAKPLPCFTLPDTCRVNENMILIEE